MLFTRRFLIFRTSLPMFQIHLSGPSSSIFTNYCIMKHGYQITANFDARLKNGNTLPGTSTTTFFVLRWKRVFSIRINISILNNTKIFNSVDQKVLFPSWKYCALLKQHKKKIFKNSLLDCSFFFTFFSLLLLFIIIV